MTFVSALDPLVKQQQELQQQFAPSEVFMAQPIAPIGFNPVEPPQRQARIEPPPPPAQQGGMGGGFNPQMLEMFGVDMGGSGGGMFGGGAGSGGATGATSGGAGGGSWLASAGPWAALAAVIMINEEEARKSGARDESRTDRAMDMLGGKVLEQDIQKRWLKDRDDPFSMDAKAVADLMTLDFSNAADQFKEGTLGKLLGGLF